MKTYHNHRAEPYFTFVKNGQKTIEGRVKKAWYRFVSVGDHIIIYNAEETDSIAVIVRGVRTYGTIREMLIHEPLKKLLPDVDTVEQGIRVYRRFYSEDQEKEFGVVAIEVERIK
ncbi:MAG: ASCH domain-containing protein [Patescibacteria group bacterium]